MATPPLSAPIGLKINGKRRTVDVDADTALLWALRDVLGMTGTKFGCGKGLCGACTVHVDGVATRSCVTPVQAVTKSEVRTIESLKETRVGRELHQAWLEHDVVQCGYCQPGQLMAAAGLLAKNPAPSDADIDAAMAGNLCRCGTYHRIRAAIHTSAGRLAASAQKA